MSTVKVVLLIQYYYKQIRTIQIFFRPGHFQGKTIPIFLYPILIRHNQRHANRHSISLVNSSKSIISGGRTNADSYSNLTWYYNHFTQEFQPGPSLMEGRRDHASGTVMDQETQEKIVVVAGQVSQVIEFLLQGVPGPRKQDL